MYSLFCLRISCDQTRGFTNISFETCQPMVNEDHTSGCRRTARGNSAPAVARRSQPWLRATTPPDQIETLWRHKFSPKTTKTPPTGHTAIASGTPHAHMFYLHYWAPKVRFWLRGSIYNPFCDCWLASVLAHNARAWRYHHQESDPGLSQSKGLD